MPWLMGTTPFRARIKAHGSGHGFRALAVLPENVSVNLYESEAGQRALDERISTIRQQLQGSGSRTRNNSLRQQVNVRRGGTAYRPVGRVHIRPQSIPYFLTRPDASHFSSFPAGNI